ncbi:MAG: hypothetical protein F6J86_07965 [Symploca sp. SIO1B1]|nr:hypothetical protein [Symploca sp. SIO1B1]
MRYLPLLLLLPFSLPLSLPPASAAEPPNVLERRRPLAFWSQAEYLVQQQLNLIQRINKALASPDLNRVKGAQGQLFSQERRVKRFLESQYPIPEFLCRNGQEDATIATKLDTSQRKVYCALYSSMRQLQPIDAELEHRLPMLLGLRKPELLTSTRNSPFNPQETVLPRFSPVPDFPDPEPPVLGSPAKRPLAGYEPPFQPAIAPSEEVSAILSAARKPLLAVLDAFPPYARIIDSAEATRIADRGDYALWATDVQKHNKFLALPGTGIARVLSAESYRLDPNRLRNRAQPTVAERFPFVPLLKSNDGYAPRFTLEVADGKFWIPMPGIDYGFLMNLGDLPLEELEINRQNTAILSSEQVKLFLDYEPPNRLETLQAEQRRFLTTKIGAGFIPSLTTPASNQTPVVLNNTYLLRLVQFQLPEEVVTGEPISRNNRRYLNLILDTPSSDLLVAFRPVQQRFDGSYIVLWRVLDQFPEPQIVDLHRYVELD